VVSYTRKVDGEPDSCRFEPVEAIGRGHIAFEVKDVNATRENVIAAGGSALGTIETVTVPGAGVITWTYVRDPEGNIIELQRRG
jgi:predicted enzyme related to lactoylglutathione lyase